jgi:hypothetical protein
VERDRSPFGTLIDAGVPVDRSCWVTEAGGGGSVASRGVDAGWIALGAPLRAPVTIHLRVHRPCSPK